MTVETNSEDPDMVCSNCNTSLNFTEDTDLLSVRCPVCGFVRNQVEFEKEQSRQLENLFRRIGKFDEKS